MELDMDESLPQEPVDESELTAEALSLVAGGEKYSEFSYTFNNQVAPKGLPT